MTTFREISWEEFVAEFKPLKNDVSNTDTYDGYMFETYGADYMAVKTMFALDKNKVWTLLSEDNTTWISSGLHWVNRMGYFLTEIPCPADVEIEADKGTYGCEDGEELSNGC